VGARGGGDGGAAAVASPWREAGAWGVRRGRATAGASRPTPATWGARPTPPTARWRVKTLAVQAVSEGVAPRWNRSILYATALPVPTRAVGGFWW